MGNHELNGGKLYTTTNIKYLEIDSLYYIILLSITVAEN